MSEPLDRVREIYCDALERESAEERGLRAESTVEWSDGSGSTSVSFEYDGLAIDQNCRSVARKTDRMLVLCVQTVAATSDELAFVREGIEMEACPSTGAEP